MVATIGTATVKLLATVGDNETIEIGTAEIDLVAKLTPGPGVVVESSCDMTQFVELLRHAADDIERRQEAGEWS
jgi:hypothetical protein